MDRTCSKCSKTKPLSEFYRNRSNKDGFQGQCKVCMQATQRIRYYRDSTTRERAVISTHKNEELRRQYVLDYLASHPCMDCGEPDPVVLQFDHVRGKKVMAVARLVHVGGMKRLKTEIEKCEVVCANCHRKRTATRANHYRVRLSNDERTT